MPRPRGHIQRRRPWTRFTRKSHFTNISKHKDSVWGRSWGEGSSRHRGRAGPASRALPLSTEHSAPSSPASDAGAGSCGQHSACRAVLVPAVPVWPHSPRAIAQGQPAPQQPAPPRGPAPWALTLCPCPLRCFLRRVPFALPWR